MQMLQRWQIIGVMQLGGVARCGLHIRCIALPFALFIFVGDPFLVVTVPVVCIIELVEGGG